MDTGPGPEPGLPPTGVEAPPQGAGSTPDGTVFERPHPLTPLIRGWLVLVAVAFAFGRELIPSGGGDESRVLLDSLTPILIVLGVVIVLAAVAGFLSWRFTRFVIDDDELRIETGAVFRQSKKIPFQRLQSIDVVQPLAARIFGLAELKLEAGAGDSGARLRFLSRAKAYRLRDYLLTRAAGEIRSIDDDPGPQASALTDLSTADDVIVRISSKQLVLGFLLSAEFLVPVAILTVVTVVTSISGVVVFALPALVPLLIGLATTVARQVIGQFNYTLARTGRGVRITRGLTNLTSQSVPVDRIQGINITQPIGWRRLGYHRVRIDVLGHTATAEQGDGATSDSLLFPVATREQVAIGLREILPEVDLDAIELKPAPPNARWLRWWQFRTLRHGWDDQVILTRRGRLVDTLDVVPHAKTQSVRITEGPWQRRLGLGTVHIDTTSGPVTLTVLHLARADARELAVSQLARMQRARAEATARTATGPVLPVGPGARSS